MTLENLVSALFARTRATDVESYRSSVAGHRAFLGGGGRRVAYVHCEPTEVAGNLRLGWLADHELRRIVLPPLGPVELFDLFEDWVPA